MKTIILILVFISGNLFSASSLTTSQDDIKVLRAAWVYNNRPYPMFDCIALDVVAKCENWRAIDFSVGNKNCRGRSDGSIQFYHFNGKKWQYVATREWEEEGLKYALDVLLKYSDSKCIIEVMELK